MIQTRNIRCNSHECEAFKQLVSDYKKHSIDFIEKVGEYITIAFPLVTYSITTNVFDELQKAIRP